MGLPLAVVVLLLLQLPLGITIPKRKRPCLMCPLPEQPALMHAEPTIAVAHAWVGRTGVVTARGGEGVGAPGREGEH